MSKKGEPAADQDVAEATEPTSAAKRKVSVDEIEVDLAAPEPPSKRARRALKKGKPLPEKPKSDDEDGEDGTKSKDKEDKSQRSEHGVWIGNLPFTVTRDQLRKWLINNSGGSLSEEAITRVKIPTQKKKSDRDQKDSQKTENKGFAYVDFSDMAAKVAAIALSENDIGGRKLLIKDSKSFEGRPKKEPEAEEADGELGRDGKKPLARHEINATRKIFVGNMSFQTTEDDVRRNFEKCGEIEWVKIAQFEDSGKCKGFGWVMFMESAAAAWAVKGFVKIKEKIETEEDFNDDDDNDGQSSDGQEKEGEDGDGSGNKGSKQQEKQFKTRKWWVNRMMGRELKLELAEDDAVRYKKRFGKDAKNMPQKDRDGEKSNSRERRNTGRDREGQRPRAQQATDINLARLTGAVVAHTGTTTIFDE